jgi:large subunit ribosomal protein L34
MPVFRPAAGRRPDQKERPMHYPRKVSKRKRVRKIGFRARMRTRRGRRIISRKRRHGRKVQVV